VEGQVSASVLRAALPERLESVGQCIPPAASPAADRPQAPVPASANAPEARVDGQVSASVPVVREQAADSFRLPAKRRVRNEPERTPAVAASSIRRPKKAR
jgi:hypothetical protein